METTMNHRHTVVTPICWAPASVDRAKYEFRSNPLGRETLQSWHDIRCIDGKWYIRLAALIGDQSFVPPCEDTKVLLLARPYLRFKLTMRNIDMLPLVCDSMFYQNHRLYKLWVEDWNSNLDFTDIK